MTHFDRDSILVWTAVIVFCGLVWAGIAELIVWAAG